MNKKIWTFIIGIGILYILIVLVIFLFGQSRRKETPVSVVPEIKNTESNIIENKRPDVNETKENIPNQEIEREPHQEGPLLM